VDSLNALPEKDTRPWAFCWIKGEWRNVCCKFGDRL
jgi:hypothetical protein